MQIQIFLNNWWRNMVFFLRLSYNTTDLWTENKNVSKVGKILLWQNQGKSDAGCVFLLQRSNSLWVHRGKLWTKNLTLKFVGAYNTSPGGNAPKYGQKTIDPQQCPIIRNYLAKSSVTTREHPPNSRLPISYSRCWKHLSDSEVLRLSNKIQQYIWNNCHKRCSRSVLNFCKTLGRVLLQKKNV